MWFLGCILMLDVPYRRIIPGCFAYRSTWALGRLGSGTVRSDPPPRAVQNSRAEKLVMLEKGVT